MRFQKVPKRFSGLFEIVPETVGGYRQIDGRFGAESGPRPPNRTSTTSCPDLWILIRLAARSFSADKRSMMMNKWPMVALVTVLTPVLFYRWPVIRACSGGG
jgi:hypothetical protein